MQQSLTRGLTLLTALGLVAACGDTPASPEGTVELAPVQAKMHGMKLPKITGGGVTQNDNSNPADPISLRSTGGFTARATAPGVDQKHDFFEQTDITVYEARGQLQVKVALTDDPSQKVGRAHARVVCIANLGLPAGVDGGGNPAGEIWEMRIRITKADDPAAVGLHGSIYVQDNGKEDYADENFGAAYLLDPRCGVVPFFQLEPHLKGNITVHG